MASKSDKQTVVYSDSDSSSEGYTGPPKGTFEVYRAEGESLFKNGMFRKAISSLTSALEERPGHKDCLIMRSRCYLELGELDEALVDVDATLKNYKTYYKGLYQKAEILYTKGEFEMALVFYHRGNKLRPEIQDFRKGIQKAEEAIDNTVGDPDKIQLTKEGDLSYFEDQRVKSATSKQNAARRKTPKKTTPKQKTEAQKKQDEQETKRLLGDLYGDKKYLEDLLKDAESMSYANEQLEELAKEGLGYLEKRTNFWRQQQPPASAGAKKKGGKSGGKPGGKKEGPSSALAREDPGRYIIEQLEMVDKEQSEGKFEASITRCKKCLQKVNGFTEGTLPNRAEIVGTLHSSLGSAYMELEQMEQAKEHFDLDNEIARQLDNKTSIARAMSNLGRLYARTRDLTKAIDCWSESLSLCADNNMDVMWLNHEIGKAHLELAEYEEAAERGETSLTAARKEGDDMWMTNALVLVANSQENMENFQVALERYEEALDISKRGKDKLATNAISNAIRVVKDKIQRDEGGDDSDEESVTGEYKVSATPDVPTETPTEQEQQNPKSAEEKPKPKPTPEDPKPVEEKPKPTEPTRHEEEETQEENKEEESEEQETKPQTDDKDDTAEVKPTTSDTKQE